MTNWAKYEVNQAWYEEQLKKQGGGCWICGSFPKTRRLHIDHNHKTGKIRGLLCMRCNVGIGNRGFNDDAKKLRKAAEYIEFFEDGVR